MKNLLVTGGAGFIGSNFIRYALRQDNQAQVINLDALTYAGSLENLRDLPDEARHTFIHGDICDQELVEGVLRQHQVNAIVHFAAETHVDRSIQGPSAFIRTNVTGTFSLLEAARRVWLEERLLPVTEVRFLHVSTDEVYGALGEADPPFSECSPYAPNSPYAASKAASDHLVRAYGRTYGLPYTITNCSNNYGPYQFPEKLIPLIILNALEGKPLPVYGDGGQIRDWLYVEDHCEAIWAALHLGAPGETYNLGGNVQATNLEIVRSLCQILDELKPRQAGEHYAGLIRFVADRPGHDRRYAMQTSKAQRELNWQPRHSLQDGLRQTVRWYLEHPQWAATLHHGAAFQAWWRQNYAGRGGQP
ncbi:MAG: dTDP-glucose 4,6-dehydratase [Anaerolineales bacterium]|nr:dTDP-glucose 4,6-dehydratase [Anaerolineales bacterium]